MIISLFIGLIGVLLFGAFLGGFLGIRDAEKIYKEFKNNEETYKSREDKLFK